MPFRACGLRAFGWRSPRLVLAFCFLGSRGLYDPDEGRYTNVALTMLDTGDWIDPRRNEDTGHWTKPPVTYWAIGASIATFGANPWAARLPMALSYLACIFLCWRSARRLAPGREEIAALAYMTMLMPFGAGQLVTTDFLLSAFQTLAVFAYVEGRFRADGPGAWPWLMWTAFALAFMTKGPPALLPMAVVLLFSWLSPSAQAPRRWQQARRPVALPRAGGALVRLRHPRAQGPAVLLPRFGSGGARGEQSIRTPRRMVGLGRGLRAHAAARHAAVDRDEWCPGCAGCRRRCVAGVLRKRG
jgi:hypothetical protein